MAKRKKYPDNILHDLKVAGATVEDLDFSRLTERENAVIRMYYIENQMTQKAIAERFSVTPQRMNQIIGRALRKIRKSTKWKMNNQ